MKKIFLMTTLFMASHALPNMAYAGTCPDSGWSETGKVERVEVSQNDRLKIKFDWSDGAVAVCKIGGSTTGTVPATADICKAWMSQALTAFASGKDLIVEHTLTTSCLRSWGGLTDDVTSIYIK